MKEYFHKGVVEIGGEKLEATDIKISYGDENRTIGVDCSDRVVVENEKEELVSSESSAVQIKRKHNRHKNKAARKARRKNRRK